MGRLLKQVVIITGAGSGIGRTLVSRFLAEGAYVIAVIRSERDKHSLLEEGALVVLGDVSDYETSERAVSLARENFGRLDTYIANAGIWDFHRRLEKQSAEELALGFEEILGVNLMGTVYAARASFDLLKEHRGSIIVTGSNACFLAGGGGPLYTASKFALRGLVMQLAKEFAPQVRVNGVAPGATDTSLSGPTALGQADREMNADRSRIKAIAPHVPMGCVSDPEDHSSLYVLLSSREESGYMTGTMIRSDGGLTISV